MANIHRYSIFRSWAWEFLSILLAIGLLAAISAILVWYDGKPTPDWGTQLNLNALLALLSTILRTSLVITVAQIICQQKWEWYSKKRMRPLSDLQKFDSGSRSSLGALVLMPTVMFRDTVSLIAAAVLVASFLVGPFVQQASRTTPCVFPASNLNGSLPYAHYIPRRGGLSLGQLGSGASIQGSPGDPLPDATIAILSSIISPNGSENQIRGDCSTGTCTFGNTNHSDYWPTEQINDSSSMHSTVAMCDKCVDVSSLVSSQYNGSASPEETMFTLPNGLNITYTQGSGDLAMITPSTNLQWLDDLLTPELREMSRWAYVNTTFLTVKNTTTSMEQKESMAAVCVLYPCLRTYTASITNNQLLEEEISSQVMELSVHHDEQVATSDVEESTPGGSVSWWGGMAAFEQYEAHYAAIKSPCQVGSQIYDENLNRTGVPNATSLSLYNFADPQRWTYRNVSAPESCIYRHDVWFVRTISEYLNDEIFNGSCSLSPKYQISSCSGASGTSNAAVKFLLDAFIKDDRAYSNVETWFSAFAKSMTNRFRFQYGGAAFDASLPLFDDQELPAGEVQGTVWQTETCVSAHRGWLILPICLTAITTLLMLWKIAGSLRNRHRRPVWKDNVLPLLFYRQNFDSGKPGVLPWGSDCSTQLEDKTIPMGTSELMKFSQRVPVTLRWPASGSSDDLSKNANISAIALQGMDRSPVQRLWHSPAAESLLLDTNTEHNRER